MSKRYGYTKKERDAEREIDRYLQTVNYNASTTAAGASVLDALRSMAEGK